MNNNNIKSTSRCFKTCVFVITFLYDSAEDDYSNTFHPGKQTNKQITIRKSFTFEKSRENKHERKYCFIFYMIEK